MFLTRKNYQHQSRDWCWFLLKTYFTYTHATNTDANCRIKSSLFDSCLDILILARSKFNFDEKQQKHQQQHTTVNRCHQRQDATVACCSASIMLTFQTHCVHAPMCDTCSMLFNLSTTKAHVSMSFFIPCLNRSERSIFDMMAKTHRA